MRETAIASFVFLSLSRQPRSKKIKFTSVSGNLRKVPFQSSVRGLSREVTARRPAGCVGAVFLGTSRHETASFCPPLFQWNARRHHLSHWRKSYPPTSQFNSFAGWMIGASMLVGALVFIA